MEIDYPIDKWKEQIDQFKGTEIILNLSQVGFFEPNMLTEIRCYIDYIRKYDQKFKILFPNEASSQNYAGRMGLFENIEGYEYSQNKHNTDKFISLYKIDSDNNDEISFKIREVFSEAGAPAFPGLTTSISELLDNIYYHSNVEYGAGSGYVAAQVYENRINPSLEVSIRDVGIGIIKSYVDRNENTNDDPMEIFKGAFKDFSSSTGIEGRGQGLTHAKDFIEGCSGSMVLKSGNFNAIIKEGRNLKFSKLGTYIEGTEIKITVPYDKN